MKIETNSKRILACGIVICLVLLSTIGSASAYSLKSYWWQDEKAGFKIDSSVSTTWHNALNSAMDEWNDAPSDFYYYYDSSSDNKFQCQYLPQETWNGLCSTTYSGDSIIKTIITLNTAKSWSTYSICLPGKMDVQSTATHEFGHALGLAHSTYSDATMWQYGYTGTTWKRSLHSDDECGIRAEDSD
jgi:hypothetical protein